jgi:hypothetical protein
MARRPVGRAHLRRLVESQIVIRPDLFRACAARPSERAEALHQRRQNGLKRCTSAVPAGVFCTRLTSPRPP